MLSPDAMRNCSPTMSTPETSSVTGCSTCSRVFISMKYTAFDFEIEDELDRARADVADLVGNRGGVLQHRVAKILGQHRRIGFLEHLLLVALHAAVAQAQHPAVAVRVAQQLRFDVAQRRHVLLEVDVAVAECARASTVTRWNSLVEIVRRIDHLDALAAAAVHRLDQHRIADLIRPPRRRVRRSSECRGCRAPPVLRAAAPC